MTYFFDFAKNLFQKKNIGIIIFLFFNTLLIIGMFSIFADGSTSFISIALFSIVIYFISLLLALSPVGEYILRLQSGSKEIKRIEDKERIEKLFSEVYEQAKKLYPGLNKDINIFINNDETPNAFAIGRKTITINRGLLSNSDQEIKAVLAHEFCHLAHKDTDLILVVYIGNFIVTSLFIVIRLIGLFIGFVFAFYRRSISEVIQTVIIDLILVFCMYIWTKIGTLLVKHSSRKAEFVADKFAYDCGYGNELASVLDSLQGGETNSKSIFSNLASTHPSIDERIGYLQELGASYRRPY